MEVHGFMKDVFLLHILYFSRCTMTVGLELGSQMSKFHSFFTYCIRICVSYVQYPENILWKLQHWFTGIPFNVDKIRWSELQETSKGFPQHPVPILSAVAVRQHLAGRELMLSSRYTVPLRCSYCRCSWEHEFLDLREY